nr:unnamed protein product [Trichobilharzia regenti]
MNNLQFTCHVCNVRCDTESVLRLHEQGKKHRSKCLNFQKNNSSGHINQPLKVSLPVLNTPESTSSKDLSWEMRKPSPRIVTNSTSVPQSLVDMPSVDSNTKLNEDIKPKFLNPDGSFSCNSCDARMNSWEQLAAHLRGRKHQIKSNINIRDLKHLESITTPPDGGDAKSIFFRCEDCEAIVFSSAMREHLASEEHKLETAKIHRSSVLAHPSSNGNIDHVLPLREYGRSCKEVLRPVWPSVKFTDAEAALLTEAAKNDDDCILPLLSPDGRSRVGLHLADGLLTVNRNFPGSCVSVNPLQPNTTTTTDITCVLWIAPEKPMTSHRTHSTFTFQPGGETSSNGRPLIFAYPPFDPSVLSGVDIVRTDSDGFKTHLAWLLMQQKFLCAIIIEDVKAIYRDEEFCQLLKCYLKVYSHHNNRGRIICFSESKVEPGGVFSSFTQYKSHEW